MQTNRNNRMINELEEFKFHKAKSGSSMRIKEAILQKRVNGCWFGQAPAFYKRIKDKSGQPTLAKVCDSNVLTEIFEVIASRQKTPLRVWLELKADGINIPRRTFYKILSNWVYTGKVSIPSFDNNKIRCWIKGLHKPLVDEVTFLKVQEVLSEY